MLLKKIILIFVIMQGNILGKTGTEEIIQPRVGNLALPGTMQPGSFIALGQTIIDKGDSVGVIFPDIELGKKTHIINIIPSFLYGIRDDLAFLMQLPITAQSQYKHAKSSGIQTLSLQLEYAFYTDQSPSKTNQLTTLGALYLPTGGHNKDPLIGFGSTSFLFGGTASHLSTEWYCYTSYGALITTHYKKNNKAGNTFYYQAGFGKNIAYSPDKWLLTWLIEFDGIYTQRSKRNGITNRNSGGNVIFLGPSLWFSTQNFIFQVEVSPVVFQHLFGSQQKNIATVELVFGWKF